MGADFYRGSVGALGEAACAEPTDLEGGRAPVLAAPEVLTVGF